MADTEPAKCQCATCQPPPPTANSMTLRDHFAAQAAPEVMRQLAAAGVDDLSGDRYAAAVAAGAYSVADAMIAARAK